MSISLNCLDNDIYLFTLLFEIFTQASGATVIRDTCKELLGKELILLSASPAEATILLFLANTAKNKKEIFFNFQKRSYKGKNFKEKHHLAGTFKIMEMWFQAYRSQNLNSNQRAIAKESI